MRVRPHVDAVARAEFRRPEVIEEDERADHAAFDVRQRAADRQVPEIDAARHHDEVDGVGRAGVAGGRVLVRGEGHLILLDGTLRTSRLQPVGLRGPIIP